MAKPRILIDTNILIDVLANRQPFVTEAKLLWDAHVDSKMDGYVAAVSLTNFFYIMRRLGVTNEEVWKGVRVILDTFYICEVNEVALRYAAQLPGDDFEDNVQIACAVAYQLDGIATRDDKGFKHAPLTAFHPADLLVQLGKNGE